MRYHTKNGRALRNRHSVQIASSDALRRCKRARLFATASDGSVSQAQVENTNNALLAATECGVSRRALDADKILARGVRCSSEAGTYTPSAEIVLQCGQVFPTQ
jgi:hypothetical protein